MEYLISSSFLILFIALLTAPFYIYIRNKKLNLKYNFIIYFFFAFIFSVFTMTFFAWWSQKSNEILLVHFGYHLDGMNNEERIGKVKKENLEIASELIKSQGGIGWPLKAIFAIANYIPYILLVYLILYLQNKKNKKVSIN